MDQHLAELVSLRTRHQNVLVEGPVVAIAEALLQLEPQLPVPIVRKGPRAPLVLGALESGTLILDDIETLSADEQARLVAWLDGAKSRVQVVSTTDRPLFPLIERGLFDAVLYYRLNVIRLLAYVPRHALLHERESGARVEPFRTAMA